MNALSDYANIANVPENIIPKEGTYTNSERKCNRANKAVEPLGDTKSDFDIVIVFSKYFDNLNEMKRVSEGQLCDYSGITYELLQEHGGIQ